MRDLRALHVHDVTVGLEVDMVQTAKERLLQHIVDAGVVQHGQKVVHGQDRLTQRLDEHVFSLKKKKEVRNQAPGSMSFQCQHVSANI
jgi:hypothetical protein